MRKVKQPTIKWVYVDSEESERRRKQAFNRIFQIAKQNIIERRKLNQIKTNKEDSKA